MGSLSAPRFRSVLSHWIYRYELGRLYGKKGQRRKESERREGWLSCEPPFSFVCCRNPYNSAVQSPWLTRGGGIMANQYHLEILKLGVETWNQWRDNNPEIKPDLSEAFLHGKALKGGKFI